MKRIDLTSIGEVDAQTTARGILRMVVEQSPGRAFTVDEMRKRIKIMDKIDAGPTNGNGSGDYLDVEDAEHTLLKSAFDNFPWQRANAALVAIADALDAAKAPPALAEHVAEAPKAEEFERRAKPRA